MFSVCNCRVLVCLIALAMAPASSFAHGRQVGQGGQGGQGGRQPAANQITSIEERTNGLKKIDGFYPLYLDEAGGKLWLEIPKLDTEVLYSTGLATGLGSNDIGLDRGILTGSRIVKFERAGPRVLMVQPNYQFRALTTNAAEAKTVRDAFARSVLWGFQIAAVTGDRVLVDFTEYLVRDGNDMASRMTPGSYRFDATRSSIYPPMTLGFPKNTEMEAELTFVRNAGGAGGPGGGRGGGGRGGGGGFFEGVGSVAASAEAASIRVHHSIVELPDANYKTRLFDPRSGFGGTRIRELRGAAGRADDAALHRAAIACRRRIRPRPSASRSSRSSTTSTPAHPNRSDRRCSTARDGGTRRSRPPAIATRSASSSCPTASARSTSATTSSTGCTAPRAAGARAAASAIRARAKSSRAS